MKALLNTLLAIGFGVLALVDFVVCLKNGEMGYLAFIFLIIANQLLMENRIDRVLDKLNEEG